MHRFNTENNNFSLEKNKLYFFISQNFRTNFFINVILYIINTNNCLSSSGHKCTKNTSSTRLTQHRKQQSLLVTTNNSTKWNSTYRRTFIASQQLVEVILVGLLEVEDVIYGCHVVSKVRGRELTRENCYRTVREHN